MESEARLRLSPAQVRALAAEFGTPLYVLDEAHLRARLRRYQAAFWAVYPRAELTYASKANSTLAVLRIAYQEGFQIDVASGGELAAALAAGVPASHCHLHGNNKQLAELEFAVSAGIGMIVLDNEPEMIRVAELNRSIPCVLRLAPGVDPVTHAKISTGQSDTKFGFNIADGSAERATKLAMSLGLNLVGFHCHVGSQLLDPEAQRAGGEAITQFAVAMAERHGFVATHLNVGGGLGIRYTEKDIPMPVEDYCRLIVEALENAFRGTALDTPELTLAQEPGRSCVGESGVTLYQVGVIKKVPAKDGLRTYVCVDGGLSDNPRPALYGSQYPVELVPAEDRSTWDYEVDGPGAAFGIPREQIVTISGKHCETDRLFPDVALPSDVQVGDFIQVGCTGAYNASMASNYNRYPRPASVLVRTDGTFALVQRRETYEEVLMREQLPEGL
jgi:diaminopimelate decarboxylase